MQTTQRDVVSGKNIGRANETTPLEQAVKEAQSALRSKLRSGYTSLSASSSTSSSAGVPEAGPSPMLLSPYKEGRITAPPHPSTWLVQPKLDGIRMVALRSSPSSAFTLYSRTGLVFHHDALANALDSLFPPSHMFLDGELYAHGVPLQTLSGAVRKLFKADDGAADDAASLGIRFHVFDGAPSLDESHLELPYTERSPAWDFVPATPARDDLVARVPTLLELEAPSKGDHAGMEAFESALVEQSQSLVSDQGYEGAVLRLASSPYQLAKRSTRVLKYKFWEEEEFEVVGHKTGDGREVGCIIWTVYDPVADATFDVRPRGSLEERKALAQAFASSPSSFLGARLTVRHHGRPAPGSLPRFGVGIALRDYE